jgi:LPXTG-motif cell wall-anchored protein
MFGVEDVATPPTEGPSLRLSCFDSVNLGLEADPVRFIASVKVRNSGDEGLQDLVVSHADLGDLSSSFSDTLSIGAVEEHEFEAELTEDEADALQHTATATATGAETGQTVETTVTCAVAIGLPGGDGDSGDQGGELPATGYPAAWLVGLGLLALATGIAVRRRAGARS